jgi:hypothetical protein
VHDPYGTSTNAGKVKRNCPMMMKRINILQQKMLIKEILTGTATINQLK